MRIGDLSATELARHLRGAGLHIDTGAFSVRVRSDIADLARTVAEAYVHHRVEVTEIIDHFDVAILREKGLR